MAGLPPINDSRRLDYVKMWETIKKNRYYALPPEYTDELLIAIFWEETTFCNIREVKKDGPGPAVGFGQAQVYAEGSAGVVWRFPTYTRDQLGTLILGDENFSVKFTGMLLTHMHSRTNSRGGTLAGYASGGNKQVKQVTQWNDCEKLLLQNPQSTTFTTPGGFTIPCRKTLEDALNKAKPNQSRDFFPQVLNNVPYS